MGNTTWRLTKMAVVKIVDDKQYEFKVFTDDGEKFRVAEEADKTEDVIIFQMQKVGYEARCKIDDTLMEGRKDKTYYNIGTNQRALMRKAVKGWSNIQTEDGNEFPYSYVNFDNLHPKLIKIIEEHVIDENGIREEREKN